MTTRRIPCTQQTKDEELISQAIASLDVNPNGLKDHETMWLAARQQAAEKEPYFLKKHEQPFLHHACSIEFAEITRNLSSIDPINRKPLPEGDVYLGSARIHMLRSAVMRICINQAKLPSFSSALEAWPTVQAKWRSLGAWLQDASSRAVLRPSKSNGKNRDQRTFHQKADSIYSLLKDDTHLVFGLKGTCDFELIEAYLEAEYPEYKRMLGWCCRLYHDRISAYNSNF